MRNLVDATLSHIFYAVSAVPRLRLPPGTSRDDMFEFKL